MRTQPTIAAPTVTVKQTGDVITQVREYQLITPLFGGGVTPREIDPVTIIRGSTIRGHLRFWWRACRAGQFQNMAAMKKAEDAIWGKAYKKGDKPLPQEQTVQITIEIIKQGSLVKPFRIETDNRGRNKTQPHSGVPPYAAFPLLPDQDELRKPSAQIHVSNILDNPSFRLTITFPKDKKDAQGKTVGIEADIAAALWAWETFGGLGARTRRGFGAIRIVKVDDKTYTNLPTTGNAKVWLEEQIGIHVRPGTPPAGIPHLRKGMQLVTTNPTKEPKEAWRYLIKKLSEFRQVPYGRDGRSFWPEPEAIRELTHRRDAKYRLRSQPRTFPRAAFGLPMVFHFKDRDDPGDTTLQGAETGHDRFSSPLILRPLSCKDGQTVGLALVLEGPRTPPKGLILIENGSKKPPYPVTASLTGAEAKTLPMLNGETDVLKAFLKYL